MSEAGNPVLEHAEEGSALDALFFVVIALFLGERSRHYRLQQLPRFERLADIWRVCRHFHQAGSGMDQNTFHSTVAGKHAF